MKINLITIIALSLFSNIALAKETLEGASDPIQLVTQYFTALQDQNVKSITPLIFKGTRKDPSFPSLLKKRLAYKMIGGYKFKIHNPNTVEQYNTKLNAIVTENRIFKLPAAPTSILEITNVKILSKNGKDVAESAYLIEPIILTNGRWYLLWPIKTIIKE